MPHGDVEQLDRWHRDDAVPRAETGRWRSVRVAAHYAAMPERVFAAWLEPRTARKWLFATAGHPIAHVEIDARVGGAFRFVDHRRRDTIEHAGRYVEIVPGRRLALVILTGERRYVGGRVTVDIALRGRGSRLSLLHENVPADDGDEIEGRWAGMLFGLEEALEQDTQMQGEKR